MTLFAPPTSGVLLGVLVDTLSLRQTKRLKSSTARDYFSGKAVKDDTLREVVEDFVAGLLEADLFDWPADGPPRAVVVAGVLASAVAWDGLVGRYRSGALPVPDSPIAGRAFARLAVVDLALRLGALRRRCGLGPAAVPPADDAPGLFLRRLLHDRRLTRDAFAELARVSTTTVDSWCDAHVSIAAENILDVACAIEPTDEERRTQLVRGLRGHYAVWQLRRALVFLGDDFLADALPALVRIGNVVNESLGQSRLAEPERTRAFEATVILGRCLESTRFLRRHASRTEADAHWHAALIAEDLRYVEGHAQWLAASIEFRAQAHEFGFPNGIDGDLLDAVADAPPLGLAKPETPPRGGHRFVISGDASFKASNRAALSHAAELVGDHRLAVEELRRAVEHEPTKALWHFKLGALLGQRGDADAGIAECRIAAALEPAWDLPAVEVGIILLDAQRPREALDALLEARRQDPRPSALLLYHLGLAHFCAREVEAALGCFRSALEQQPEYPLCMNMAAEALFTRAESLAGDERRRTKEEALRFAKAAALRGVGRALERWRR